jgi:exodeoxyribonuclease VII small subunit
VIHLLKGFGMTDQPTFEQALNALEEAVTRLEKGQLPLDDALASFESGVQNAQLCRKLLQDVQGRVELLLKNTDDTFSTESFNDADDAGGE